MRARRSACLGFDSILGTALVVSLLATTAAQAQTFTVVGQVPNALYSPAGDQIAQGRNGICIPLVQIRWLGKYSLPQRVE